MKHFLTLASFCFFSAPAMASDTEEVSVVKKPRFDPDTDLPEAGEIALGFNAAPLLNFGLNLVNIMNDTGDKADGMATYPAGGEQAITGKYFLSSEQAIRVRLGLNHSSTEEESLYDDPVVDPTDNDAPDTLTDKIRSGSSSIIIGGGMEFRRGKGRLVGIYGGEALLGFAGSSSSTQYGWSYSDDAAELGVIGNGSSRQISERSGMTIGLGLRGFAGVEYFIAPKISIGAEFGWALAISSTGQGEIATEVWEVDDDGDGSAYTKVDKTGGSSGFLLGHDDGGAQPFAGGSGAISLMFHF